MSKDWKSSKSTIEKKIRAQQVRVSVSQFVSSGKMPSRLGRIGSEPWKFYCPVCGTSCMSKMHPSPFRASVIAGVLSAGAVCTILFWSWFQWKGLFLIFPIWAVTETVYRLIARAQVFCEQCGFDPVLYLSNPTKAMDVVFAKFENHHTDISSLTEPETKSSPSTQSIS